jgi:hypothetical protein
MVVFAVFCSTSVAGENLSTAESLPQSRHRHGKPDRVHHLTGSRSQIYSHEYDWQARGVAADAAHGVEAS